ncbi:MAG TPA: leucyl aminopeptidase [Xanthomonadales bacterium]|nr:leucyl aminopeptidase [Xanthomonadales bacterium]
MSLPDCFLPLDAAAAAIPLTLIEPGDWPDRIPVDRRARLVAQGFTGKPGAWAVLTESTGSGAAFACVEDRADPHALAVLPSSLPEGDYRLVDSTGLDADVVCLGWGLGGYRFDRYRTAERAPARLAILPEAHQAVLGLVEASRQVRDLVNTPTQDMGPAELEATVRALAEQHAARFRVIVGEDLLVQGFPAIHAVGRASHRAPRLLELEWGLPEHPLVAVVGKGVCFDTGGLDIKVSSGMRNMKKDMGGAAHAIALARLILERRLPVRVRLLVPAVENAIGPDAYRPGEVLATRAGVRVEIDNTDAEGRVILCDALTYAGEAKPDLMIDFATLTGAARIALGPDLPVLYCNDERLAADCLAAGERNRDPLWRLPLWRPYRRYLKSGIADLANSGASRMAGSITAALYLQHFVPDGVPWLHVDVYAWCDGDRPGHPAGGEAQGLRALFELLRMRYPN